MAEEKRFYIVKAEVLPFGAYEKEKDLIISLPTEDELDSIVLLDKKSHSTICRLQVGTEYRTAGVYSVRIQGGAGCDYLLVGKNGIIKDTYAKVVCGTGEFGRQGRISYKTVREDFDWQEDRHPCHPYEDSLIYKLHVRGFTKHISSKVKHRGTFAGILEKLCYLKDLGITAVELMPAYEFEERIIDGSEKGKLNFWGYGNAHYFAPKEAYSSRKNGGQVYEFKEMVRELHRAGIEVIMDFYFVPGTNPYLIMDCLRYWVLEYHIDGIHLNREVVPVDTVKADPVMSGIKLFADSWEAKEGKEVKNKGLAVFNDEFMVSVRRFIKSDEGQVYALSEKIRKSFGKCGVINYISNHCSFTLMDMVSYARKHNELNGEDNKDGTDYNYSWNCGMEGPTRKKKVKNMRIKQIKNALTILFLSQGTPMLFAGDEMGRTRRGNNNPYCHDNDITWINWTLLESNAEIYDYVKKLVDFRYSHRLLHMREEAKSFDCIGFPNLSFHGVEPWRTDFSYSSRQLGVLYSGAADDEGNSDSIYAAFNAYWEDVEFYIPDVGMGSRWKIVLGTEKADGEVTKKVLVPARSAVVLEAIRNEKPPAEEAAIAESRVKADASEE